MADFKWDREGNRMIIRPVGYAEASVLIKLPSRRWRQLKNEYLVPFTRMNADLLLKSPIARDIPKDLQTHLKTIAYNKIENREFPKWYAYKPFTIKGKEYNGQPLPDQRAANMKLYPLHCGAYLMPMGVGKSKALIDMVTAHYFERRINAMVLLAPLTTIGVWSGPQEGQLVTHSPAPYRVIHADSSFDWTRWRPRSDEFTWITVGLESLSSGGAFKRILPFLDNNECAIAVDESHWIKNHSALRTKAAMDLRKYAKLAYMMTGTLATRNMIDLYAQYDWLDSNIIGVGDYYAFRNRYCVMGGFKRKEIVGYNNVDELMGLIEPYTYICDVPKGLPEQVWAPTRQITMHPEQWEMYQKVKKAEIPTVSVKHVLTKMLRLAQICGGFLYEDGQEVETASGRKKKLPGKQIWALSPEKNPKLQDLLEAISQEPDRQFVVWAKFTAEIDLVAEALAKLGSTHKLYGATEDRAQVVADFQAGRWKYLVANPQIGGISWTMTAATRGYYYSNTEKLDDRLQSEKRIHRQGQDQSVLYGDWEMRTPKGGATTDTVTLASIEAKKDLDVYIKDELKKRGTKIEELY